MEDRAEIYKEMKSQIQEDRIKRKKEKIKQIIREKRMIQAQQIEPSISEKEKAQEVVEVKMEEAEEKGFKSCTKTKKNGEAERNVGAVVLPTTLKNTVQKSGASHAIGWGI